MKKILLSLFLSFALCAGALMPTLSHAQSSPATPADPDTNTVSTGDPYGFGTNLDKVAGNFKANSTMSLEERIASIIAIFLSFLGVIFLILMIYAGFNWMTAAGDEERISKSKDTIRAAIIGLVIVVAAYALSVFVIERIWGAAS